MRTLDSPEAAALVKNARALALLEAFMVQPDTLASMAGRLQIPLASAHRLVERLVAVGALEVAQLFERGGRAMKQYRATSSAFFIPYSAERQCLPHDVLRRLFDVRIDEQVSGLMKAARDALGNQALRDWGTLVYADRRGHLVVRPDFESGRTPKLLDEHSPAYLNFYLDDLRLGSGEAKQLQRELVLLLKRYKAAPQGSGAYTLSVVMAPASSKRGT